MKKPKVRLHRSKVYAQRRRFRKTEFGKWLYDCSTHKISKRTKREIFRSDGELKRIYGISLHDINESTDSKHSLSEIFGLEA